MSGNQHDSRNHERRTSPYDPGSFGIDWPSYWLDLPHGLGQEDPGRSLVAALYSIPFDGLDRLVR
jgi:hypothetical protein